MTKAIAQRRHRVKDPIRTVRLYSTRLTAAELADIMTPIRACLAAATTGVATLLQWHVLDTQAALESWAWRAMASGNWLPTALEFAEQDALTTFVDLHEFQLQQLSAGEIHRASQRMIARVQSAGGQVLHVDQDMATRNQQQGVPA